LGISLRNKRKRQRRRSYADYTPVVQKPRPRSDPFRIIFYLVAIGALLWGYLNQERVRAFLLGEDTNLDIHLSEIFSPGAGDSAGEDTGIPTATPSSEAATANPESVGNSSELARQGELAYQEGHLDDAIAFYSQAAELSPNAIEYHVQVARLLLFRSATEYEDTREATLQAALEAANHAVLADPEGPQGYAIKAMALDWSGQPERAASQALLALEQDQNYAPAHAYYAEALVDLNRWDQALEEAELAVQLAPDNLDVRRNYAYVLESLGDYDAAAAQYEQAISLHPQLVFLRLALGRTYRASGLYTDALDQFNAAEQIDPQNALIAVELGWTYQAFIGDEGTALEYYEHASELDETYARPWERIGSMRYVRGNYADAALAFERALMLGADNLNIRLQLGLSLANDGDCTDAIEHLTAARQMAEDDERTIALIQEGFDLCSYEVVPTEAEASTGGG
jgi:tetratricopeptide (TPR) repeat protein